MRKHQPRRCWGNELREGSGKPGDVHNAAGHKLDENLVPGKKAHPNERAPVHFRDQYASPHTIPFNFRIVDTNLTNRSIAESHKAVRLMYQMKGSDGGEWERQ